MDLSKPGPLYEAIHRTICDLLGGHDREIAGLAGRLDVHRDGIESHEEEIMRYAVRLRDLEQHAGRGDDAARRLEALEGTVKGLERRTNSAGLEERLKAIEDRLTLLAKAKARPVKPAASSRAKPAAKGAKT
jgi:hypothetical protein